MNHSRRPTPEVLAFRSGYAACRSGHRACPYSSGTSVHSEFQRGFAQARAEIRAEARQRVSIKRGRG